MARQGGIRWWAERDLRPVERWRKSPAKWQPSGRISHAPAICSPCHLAQNNQRYPRPQQKPTSRACVAAMSLLRRPDDHHRDLRARLPAEQPPHTGSAGDQDRYLMTLSPLTDNHPDTHSCGHLVARNAGLVRSARSSRGRTTNATQIALPSKTTARSPNLRANTIIATVPLQTPHPSSHAQIPIAYAVPPAHDRSRFRALALFGRRPSSA